MKPEKNYETKRNFTFDETKRNFAVFVFRETSEISRNNCFVSLCFMFRETKKRMRNGNPTSNQPIDQEVVEKIRFCTANMRNRESVGCETPKKFICIV
jgi:hypothetical protein